MLHFFADHVSVIHQIMVVNDIPSCFPSYCILPFCVPNVRLDGLADALEEIATAQGTNVERITDLVNENESILGAMKANLRRTVVTALAKIVMRSDGKKSIGGWSEFICI